MFPDNDKAREWLKARIWPQDPYCGSFNVQCGIKHKTMAHRCRDCPSKPRFNLKVGMVMQASNLGYRDWAIAVYLLTTNLKSRSSMKLHRDLEIAYSSAWHLAHRLRAAFGGGGPELFAGPGEANETYFGGKRKKKQVGLCDFQPPPIPGSIRSGLPRTPKPTSTSTRPMTRSVLTKYSSNTRHQPSERPRPISITSSITETSGSSAI